MDEMNASSPPNNVPPPHPIVVPLSLPTDSEYLSAQLCLLREQLEVFAATHKDIAERRSGPKPVHGTVGLRCRHCAHLLKKSRGAVVYPKSISLIHQAVRNFHRYHFFNCSEISDAVKERMRSFKPKENPSVKGSAMYWIKSSTDQLGMVDVEREDEKSNHIRFCNDPRNNMSDCVGPCVASSSVAMQVSEAAARAPPKTPDRPVPDIQNSIKRTFSVESELSPGNPKVAEFDGIDIDTDFVHEDHVNANILPPSPKRSRPRDYS